MKLKTATLMIFVLLLHCHVWGQTNFRITQYQEILPVINPAYAGIENYTDIDFGFRSQVNGFDDGPSTFFMGLSTYLDADKQVRRHKSRYKSPYNISQLTDSISVPYNGIRSSNPQLVKRMIQDSIRNEVNKLDRKERRNFRRKVRSRYAGMTSSKHGLNITLVSDNQGAFTSYLASPSYAYHLPITPGIYVSMGAGFSLSHSGFDRNKAVVLDPDEDLLYQSYANGLIDNNHSFLNAGVALYSRSFHLSYGILQLVRGNNTSTNLNVIEQSHNVVGSVNIYGANNFTFVPGFYYSMRELSPNVLALSGRVYYLDDYSIGVNYLPERSLGMNFGVLFLSKYQLSYAYDHPISNNVLGNTNEVILGIQLRSTDGPKSIIR